METNEKFPTLMELKKILEEKSFNYFTVWGGSDSFFVELEMPNFKLKQKDEKGYDIITITKSIDKILEEYKNFLKRVTF